jgi:hypothetical protein
VAAALVAAEAEASADSVAAASAEAVRAEAGEVRFWILEVRSQEKLT